MLLKQAKILTYQYKFHVSSRAISRQHKLHLTAYKATDKTIIYKNITQTNKQAAQRICNCFKAYDQSCAKSSFSLLKSRLLSVEHRTRIIQCLGLSSTRAIPKQLICRYLLIRYAEAIKNAEKLSFLQTMSKGRSVVQKITIIRAQKSENSRFEI